MTDPYVTVSDANAYFANDPGAAAWNAASASVKLVMLRKASDAIDRQLLKGKRVSLSQSRAFPRVMTFQTQIEVPQRVLDATCEEANELLKRLGSPRLTLQREGVSSASFDGSSESFREGSGHRLLSVVARELLKYDLAGPI